MRTALLTTFISLLLIVPVASAATIVSEGSSSQGVFSGIFAWGWNQSGSWSNVAVSAELASNTTGSTVTAFLTTQIGPGTTVANQIATQVVGVNSGVGNYGLFSGLSLGSGSYFITLLFSSSLTGPLGGGTVIGPTVGPGVTYLGLSTLGAAAYAPAGAASSSSIALRFNVTGDQAAAGVPEPASIGLLATGIALIGGLYRRRRYNSSTP